MHHGYKQMQPVTMKHINMERWISLLPQCSEDYGYIQISSCLSYMKSQVGVNQSSVFITVQISMYKYQWIIILGVSNGILLFVLVHLVSLSGGMPL